MGGIGDAVTGSSPQIFERHMLALGRLCVVWAFVDRLLNELIQAFLGCTAGQAATIGTEADTAAARCKMLKNFAHEGPPGEEWRGAFDRLMNCLLDDEGPKRNRYIHDYWTSASGKLERMDRAEAAVKKPQSFQPPSCI